MYAATIEPSIKVGPWITLHRINLPEEQISRDKKGDGAREMNEESWVRKRGEGEGWRRGR